MSLIESIEAYTNSQRVVALGFLTIGVVLLSIALYLQLRGSELALHQGLKIGALIFGLLQLGSGVGYYQFNGKNHQALLDDFNADTAAFVVSETERMQKVVNDFPRYQWVNAGLVVVGLLVVLLASSWWAGFCFALIITSAGFLYVEAISKPSIDSHYEIVQQQT